MIPDVWILGGMSPRGFTHAVLGDAGGVLWDPHPDRTGLQTTEHWYAVVEAFD